MLSSAFILKQLGKAPAAIMTNKDKISMDIIRCVIKYFHNEGGVLNGAACNS